MGFATSPKGRQENRDARMTETDTLSFLSILHNKLDETQYENYKNAILDESYLNQNSRSILTENSQERKDLEFKIAEEKSLIKNIKIPVNGFSFSDAITKTLVPSEDKFGVLEEFDADYSYDISQRIKGPEYTMPAKEYTYEEAINAVDSLQKEVIKKFTQTEDLIKQGREEGYISDAVFGAGFERQAGYGEAPDIFSYEIPGETGDYIQLGDRKLPKIVGGFIQSQLAGDLIMADAIGKMTSDSYENKYSEVMQSWERDGGGSILELGAGLDLNTPPAELYVSTNPYANTGGDDWIDDNAVDVYGNRHQTFSGGKRLLNIFGEGLSDLREVIASELFRSEENIERREIYNKNILYGFTDIQWLLHQRQEIMCHLEGGEHCNNTSNQDASLSSVDSSFRDIFLEGTQNIVKYEEQIRTNEETEALRLSATLTSMGLPTGGINFVTIKDVYDQEKIILDEVITELDSKVNSTNELYRTKGAQDWLKMFQDDPEYAHRHFESFIKNKYK